MADLNSYYQQQANTGVALYPSSHYQRGRGFFGRFFKGSLLPLLQSLGHKILSTGVDVADDVVNNDMDPMASLKLRGRAAAKAAANDVISTARSKLGGLKQIGSGPRKSIKGRCLPIKGVSSRSAPSKTTSKARKVIKDKKTDPTESKRKASKKKSKSSKKKPKEPKTVKKTRSAPKSSSKSKSNSVPKFLEF